MGRFTDLFKSLVPPKPPKEEIQTPSFIKPEHPKPLPTVPHKIAAPVFAAQVSGGDVPYSNHISAVQETNNPSNQVQCDKIDVPVYQSDSEWDVVQRSIYLFADNANLSSEVKEAFVRKWVAEMAKAEQTMLYRDDEGDSEHHGHLGNEINRELANSTTGLLGTYQAMLHPGRQARMTDELKALQCVERIDFTIIDLQLCRDVKMDLITTIIGTIEEQRKAVEDLIQKAQKAHPEADKIYPITKAVANCREMRLNSAIKTAVLKMDTLKYQHLGLESGESKITIEVESPISSQIHPVKKTQSRQSFNKAADNKIAESKKSESSWVDEQALKLFTKKG
ncbi:MAG: hypothetical protein ABI954_05470 [Pyrinomonadaceae bacterium]